MPMPCRSPHRASARALHVHGTRPPGGVNLMGWTVGGARSAAAAGVAGHRAGSPAAALQRDAPSSASCCALPRVHDSTRRTGAAPA